MNFQFSFKNSQNVVRCMNDNSDSYRHYTTQSFDNIGEIPTPTTFCVLSACGMSHENMSHACCNMCGLSSTFSGSEGLLLPCDNEQMDIFNFLQRKTHNNANENSSFSNYDRETHDSSNEVVLCKMCIKRIEVVSAMRSQVKFCLTKLSYVDLNNFRVKEYEFMHLEGQSSIKSLYWVVMVLWVLHELSRLI